MNIPATSRDMTLYAYASAMDVIFIIIQANNSANSSLTYTDGYYWAITVARAKEVRAEVTRSWTRLTWSLYRHRPHHTTTPAWVSRHRDYQTINPDTPR